MAVTQCGLRSSPRLRKSKCVFRTRLRTICARRTVRSGRQSVFRHRGTTHGRRVRLSVKRRWPVRPFRKSAGQRGRRRWHRGIRRRGRTCDRRWIMALIGKPRREKRSKGFELQASRIGSVEELREERGRRGTHDSALLYRRLVLLALTSALLLWDSELETLRDTSPKFRVSAGYWVIFGACF